MTRSAQFDITLQETASNFSYDLNKRSVKTYAKLVSVGTCPIDYLPVDMHGNTWEERTILNVITIEYDSRSALVSNVNGLQWITKLDNITFCDEHGNKLK